MEYKAILPFCQVVDRQKGDRLLFRFKGYYD